MAAGNLALSLSKQGTSGKCAEAELINREVLGVTRRVLGEEHPDTQKCAYHLALSLTGQEKHSETALILQGVLAWRQRVLGAAHPDTCNAKDFLRCDPSIPRPHTPPHAPDIYCAWACT